MAAIDWTVPQPRDGFAGAFDRFVGPGASRAEIVVQFAVCAAVAAGCLVLFGLNGGFGMGWVAVVVAVVLAVDLGGGVGTNATGAAKRWYHRDGQGVRQHLLFTAAHGVHMAAVAALTGAWLGLGLAYGFLMLAAAVIVLTPFHVQRPVAFGLAALGILMAQLPMFSLPAFGWFLPVLWIKLLLAHLVLEAPFAPERKR